MTRKYQNKIVSEKYTLSEIICNRCGRIEKTATDENSNMYMLNHFEKLSINFGYDTSHDMETWNFDLCENCIEEIVKEFRIPPRVSTTQI